MNNETLKKIEALEAEIKKLKDEVNNPQFEVGKWYKNKEEPKFLFYLESIKGGSYYGRGFGCSGMWHNSNNCSWGIKGCVQATDKEVEDALMAEAKRRGFKEGVKWKSLFFKGEITDYNDNGRSSHDNEFKYTAHKNTLSLGYGVIYKNGVWAEIVKDEPIRIGGYSVLFHELTKSTTIDGNGFSKEFWQSAKVISEHSKAKIMVGCSKQYDVSLEIINQILEKL